MRVREVVKRRSVQVAAAALAMGSFAVAPHSALADDCPTPMAGHWVGDWDSTALDAAGGIDEHVSFVGNAVTGTVTLTGSSFHGGEIVGTLECGQFTMGFVVGVSSFTGTLSTDGRSASGNYIAPTVNDVGTWSVKFVPDEATADEQVTPPTTVPVTSPTTLPHDGPVVECPLPAESPDPGVIVDGQGHVIAVVDLATPVPVGDGTLVDEPAGSCVAPLSPPATVGPSEPGPYVGWRCVTRDSSSTDGLVAP